MPLPDKDRVLPYAILLTAALLAILPLALAGPSCGHDLTFHLLNWMDAAHQWRAGTLRPWWCFPAAWNAGEPRFLFYPPLSWMLGALLTLVAGPTRAPLAFTFVALTAGGITMRRFLAHYVTPPLALLGACLYLAHPYMLFTATERTAYAELLAAAWLPWLLREALRGHSAWTTLRAPLLQRVRSTGSIAATDSIRPIRLAIPIALLWLTNTPSAVLGTYTLAVVLSLRILLAVRNSQPFLKPLLLPALRAYLYGLAISAFYLLPALVQHSAVEVSQAFTTGMRPEDGTLFVHTGQQFHDQVVTQASTLAVILLAGAAIAGALCLLSCRKKVHTHRSMRNAAFAEAHKQPQRALLPVLLTLTALVLFLLTPASLFLWHHAPELQFLQFPWRTLMLQGVVTVTLIVLAIRTDLSMTWAIPIALAAVAAIAIPAHHSYTQTCDDEDAPRSLAAQYARGEGFEPYDEYTPKDADNDLLHANEPPAWTAPEANAPAPPSAAASRSARILTEDTGRANQRAFKITPAAGDRFVIIRQRSFRNWHVTLDGVPAEPVPDRDDDLLAIPLRDAASHTLTLTYRWSWDEITGAILSAIAALTLALTHKRTPHPG